ncbi:MAG: rhomboid family intramembrane serine protease [Tannerellaceae bacterium]|jgi:membrane associated rhomboid family serine protease|nr:rhomboid family intramembrane serine protease [Tannerellaceae bacterium]
MDSLFKQLAVTFRTGGVLVRLLFINIGIFLIIRFTDVAFTLFDVRQWSFLAWLQLPSSPNDLLFRPWALFTYMFTHFDVWHILFNMLLLYCFGRIFVDFFSPRRLGSVYLLGGVAGGLFYMLVYNVFPFFADQAGGSMLLGASASVMAIVFAVAFYRKDFEIGLLFIGRIKLIYVAMGVMLVDILSITSSNAGGHIAHIGGALLGAIFAVRLKAGSDFTAWISRLLDKVENIGKRSPKLKVTYNTQNIRQHQADPAEDIDIILEKIKQSGYSSLSSKEKSILFEASKR